MRSRPSRRRSRRHGVGQSWLASPDRSKRGGLTRVGRNLVGLDCRAHDRRRVRRKDLGSSRRQLGGFRRALREEIPNAFVLALHQPLAQGIEPLVDIVDASERPIGASSLKDRTRTKPVSARAVAVVVEIELNSSREFLPQGEMLVLRIGAQEFSLSRYLNTGETNTVVFTLTAEEFARISQGDAVKVQYGSGGNYTGWNFGKVDKNMLGR